MLRLIVLRHAKSDWSAGVETDHARPLNERGRREAPLVGAQLSELGLTPDLVLSSDAQRTTETVRAILPHFPGVTVRFEKDLYLAGMDVVRDLASALDPMPKQLLVVGHNPGWEDMVSELVGSTIELKTATAAVLESEETDWRSALQEGARMRLVHLVAPRL